MPPLVASDGFARAYPEGLREMAQISSPSSLTKSIKTLERLELSVLVWTYFLAQKLVMSAFPFPKDMFFQDLILFSQTALRSILGRKLPVPTGELLVTLDTLLNCLYCLSPCL